MGEARAAEGTEGMSDTIPDAVIEAMAEAIAQDDEWYSPNGTRHLYRQDARRAIAVAEKLGWRLCPREPTTAMRCHSTFEASERWWPMMWDAAPKVSG